jgi:hypothetical protein
MNRANDIQGVFEQVGDQIDWDSLLAANSEQDVAKAFAPMHEDYQKKFAFRFHLVLECLRDKKFPTQDRNAQKQFIADSLAGDGRITIRRSRDICQEERSKLRKQGTIIRREFYIVCSCGYKGPGMNNACPKCGAVVSMLDFALGVS